MAIADSPEDLREKQRVKHAIFLNDGSIMSWDKQVEPGIRLPDIFGGPYPETKLVSSLGFNSVNERFNGHLVVASAAKYLADVCKYDHKKGTWREDASPERPSREVLFEGTIAIYREGQIPGTEVDGYGLVENGRIWLSRTPNPLINGRHGLYQIIFENSTSDLGMLRRIKRIADGYKIQRENRRKAESNAIHESWQRGRFDAMESAFGTFNPWPA